MRTRTFLVVALVFVLACSSSEGPDSKAEKHAAAAAASAADSTFPPQGPIELRYTPPPKEGVLYQLLVKYEGRTESQPEGEHSDQDAQTSDELLQLELDYRQVPVPSDSPEKVASSLELDSLRRRLRMSPPGTVLGVELADDRLRVIKDEKVDIDLRGAQPKGDITPRGLLNRPFALLVSDRYGNPTGVTLKGIPTIKKMLAAMPIRDSVGYLQIAYPQQPVRAGDTWKARRYFASPAGRVGIGVDVEYRLVGFEKLDGVPCAHIALRANLDGTKVKSALGFEFDEARLLLTGDAWIGLDTGLVELVRLQDIVAVSYKRAAPGSVASRMRMRYETRASLQRLDLQTTAKMNWADGAKRFADVGEGKSLGLKGAQ